MSVPKPVPILWSSDARFLADVQTHYRLVLIVATAPSKGSYLAVEAGRWEVLSKGRDGLIRTGGNFDSLMRAVFKARVINNM
jgi:hypothetical protein